MSDENNASSRRDTSFKMCVCLLLIFIAICVIILLAGTKWSSNTPKEETKEGAPVSQGSKGVEDEGKKIKTTTTFVPKNIPTKPTTRIPSTRGTTPNTLRSTKPSDKVPKIIVPQTEPEQTTTAAPVKEPPTKATTIIIPQTETEKSSTRISSTKETTANTLRSTKPPDKVPKVIISQTEPEQSSTVTSENVDKDLRNTTSPPNQSSKIPTEVTNEETSEKPTIDVIETNITSTSAKPNITNSSSTTIKEPEDIEGKWKENGTTFRSTPEENTQKPTPTNGETNEDYYSTEITETNATPAIVIKGPNQKPSTTTNIPPTPVIQRPLTTTPKPKVDDGGQKSVFQYEYEYENWNITNNNSTLLFKKPEPICLSVPCKTAASRMLRLMDHSIDACNDFYEFSCGGMSTENPHTNTWKRISKQLHLINEKSPSYLQTFKTFYDSCVSHEYEFDYQKRIDSVLKLVKEVGGILHEPPPKGTIDITQLFAKLILRQSLPFIDIDIDIDKQTSEFILKLTLPKPTSILKESGRWPALTEAQKRCLDYQRHELEQPDLDLTKIYELYLECQKDHAIYLNSVETAVRSLGFYTQLNNTYDESQRIQDLRTTIEWDILDHLNTLPSPSHIRQTMLFKNYTIFKISDLQIQNSLLEWNKLFNEVTGHTLPSNTMVQVYFPPYFTNIFQKIKEVPDWKLNNALIAIYANNLYENLVIPQAKHTRENYCLKLSSNLFQDISSNLYMRTWPQTEIEESQQFLTKIFDKLKQNLTLALQNETWLDDVSLTRILLKLNKMKLTFNKQTDSYNDEEALNNKYKDVTMTTDFQANAVKMLEMDRKMKYALVGKTYSTDYLWSYFLNAYDTVPASFYSKGLILAPLGMVKQPVKGFPGYITMARIGLSLAKEIGRHFDPVGIQNDLTLMPDAKTTYEEMKTVMESESLFHVTRLVGHQMTTFMADPILSVNERIADNTGFRLISDSFDNFGEQDLLPWVSTSFSIEQIFYITVAQEYCQKTDMPEFMQQLFESEILPAALRVENIVTNSKQFSKAFNCGVGSPMNNNPSKMQFPHLQEEDEEEEPEEEL